MKEGWVKRALDTNSDIQRQVQTREIKEVFRQQQRNIKELLDRVEKGTHKR